MLRKLTLDQINDWFTIGKTVTDVELLGSPPAFPAEAARDEAQRRDSAPRFGPAAQAQPAAAAAAPRRPLSRKSSEMEYINKYRQLEAQEFDMYGSDQSPSRPGPRPALTKLNNMTCIPETHYKYPDLPINRCKEEVISLIESNSVVIIHGATGSGKSTQLPQYILDHYIQRSAYCNIVVTQPRKIGASSIARWISRERAWTLGGLVGYQVGLEKIATEDTKLIYMTTGVLLQKIVSAKSLMEFTHVFIDEVHERTEDMDFLLLVVRKLLRTNSRFVKVILMSATINCKEFADYFAVPVQNKMNPAYVFEVEGKPHSIEEYYLDDLGHIHHGRLSPHVLEEPVIPKNIYEVAVSLIQIFDNLDMQESGLPICNRSKTWSGAQFVLERSSVLVFLPGLGEINYMHELLTNMVHKRLQVYPLHSSVTLEEQNNVFLSPVPGYRKIILSTNIAESSVTVPDVKYVIDFCLTRTLVCDEDTNYQSLRLSWASKTSCNQRKGRAGRVSKGYCYRLVHRDFWDSSIPDHVIPEMLRCPLGSTVLKVKLLDMGEPRALLATALSPPSLSDIERTILLLKEVGALAVSGQREDENPHDGELTFLGRVLAQLPVNQQLGKLIVLGHVFGCLDECLIIAAALSLKNFFAMPFRQHLDGYRNKVNFSGNSKSDCIALVEAFKTWQTCRQSGELRHPKDELDWGRLHYVQIKRIREVAELYEELKNRISQFNMYVDSRRPVMDQEYIYKQRFILQVVLAGAFYPNYFTFGQPDEEMAVRELAGKDPKTTIVLKHIPPYGFLYYKQLQSLFRQCGQVKSIVFDGAKAFVEFSRNPTERFKTLPAVYMAIKMSQLKVSLELNVHSAEEIEGKVQGGAVSKLRSTRVNVDFQKQTVDPMQVSFNTLDPSQTITDLLLTVDVTEVFFVDYGNRSHVDLDLLMEIPYQLLELPFQALEFKICKMRPSAKSLICGEHWSGGASQRFASLVSGCALLVRVFSVVHSVLHVDVYRYAGVQDTVNVRDILIKEGYAELAEEPYESKQSHEALKGLFSKSIQNMADMTVSSPVKDDEKYLIRVLLESFSSNKLGPPNCKAILHGPFNPYELKCHSLTRISKFRCVWIEKESINSVIISDAPEDLHQRMLVAASLSVNATGSTMLLRETSLMPHVPGLPALLSALFAPVMELRVDRDGKCYTGVLCGLGWNPTTGAPILPEHDIELAFDVQFNVEDIVEINILRAAINKLVCDGPNGSKFLGPERIAQLQDNARQKLLGLFCQLKPRQRVVPKWHEKPYEWNQVDPKLVMEQADRESSRGKNTFLYQLHKLIVLNT
ncbi:ATP-dependent RNA helicase TDRD9 isoform X5 [Canis lupus baileyi]|uniref:ATP-dependent RNA helicase TDRD9 isoform X5 n=1 Tax=Canis lupus dingo TaxID=286419 RepID=UPI000DC66766|nr:ATP-dependent RNA helicase TDRD9 isoform X5 [Canis lupus dingo]XP_038401806.1 ATP-dependent RNA helicase TDRD9 isoform X4 [Canis lupus familiaris]XP_038452598.1 ATP-dependent RNA helicase TDRD9 isoform X4 [Canis lupus familiaris]XP_038530715.1 ATP-dependent RNA helicase TDRD9 isoform X4 [Canis lupus familiaris]